MRDARPGTRRAFELATAAWLLCAATLCGGVAAAADAFDSKAQVLFVCQHGNVKSVMAAAYFNELAMARGLPLRAASRGVAPDSASVPPSIVAELRTEGIDVSGVRPLALRSRDASESLRVVAIGVELPQAKPGVAIERWDDVPPASTNYVGARDSLRAHVRDLLARLSNPAPK